MNTFRKNYSRSLSLSKGPAIIFLLALIAASCKKDHAVVDAGYEYFPDDLGHWVIYNVDSTVYDDFNNDTDYYHYQIKEVIQSYYTDNEGRQAMRVERYKRPYIDSIPYDSLPWTISRVWTFVRTNDHAEKVEEDQRFVRLAFVPRQGKTWDGNSYNTIGEWNYEYEEVDQPYTINNLSFDSTVEVNQKTEKNFLQYRIYHERYAKHVGMIEKNVIDVKSQNLILPPYSVLDSIHSGVIYNIRAVDWGPR